jgi:hypothetical protein
VGVRVGPDPDRRSGGQASGCDGMGLCSPHPTFPNSVAVPFLRRKCEWDVGAERPLTADSTAV